MTLGWGVMGTGVALTLGGSPGVCLLAFLAACAIDRTQRLMSRLRLPSFYLQAAGGFVATLIAVVAAATPLEVNPSRVVTAGIVMLLAGIGLMGATQDAMTGFPVTASARLLDAMLDTAGIIAGVAGRPHRRRRCSESDSTTSSPARPAWRPRGSPCSGPPSPRRGSPSRRTPRCGPCWPWGWSGRSARPSC